MTYGQLAELAADVCPSAVSAVTVGRIMAGSGRSAPDLPWWRVIGKEGDYGVLRKRRNRSLQQDLLAQEGVAADREGRYDLSTYQYWPPGSARPAKPDPK
jgi:alkylated DNA nucleotide flippase Atl1